MDFDFQKFRITEGAAVDLAGINTEENGGFTKDEGLLLLSELKKEMSALQDKLYAANKKSLLIIFQAMDAAGKDSAVKHVMSGLNPQGCQVYSFKQPSAEELDHDFLWRHYKALPERGRIGIHNRSHYENVIICKVHPKLAASESGLPIADIDHKFWEGRYKSITDFEQHLYANGTVILKFFLHISKREQKKRFLSRIDDPAKNWKFSTADITEREQWDKYMLSYQEAFAHTSRQNAPWFVIPADKKWFGRTAVCSIIVDTLKNLDLAYPTLPDQELQSLRESRKTLMEETDG